MINPYEYREEIKNKPAVELSALLYAKQREHAKHLTIGYDLQTEVEILTRELTIRVQKVPAEAAAIVRKLGDDWYTGRSLDDKMDLYRVAEKLELGHFGEAYAIASYLDTILRDQFPDYLWKIMSEAYELERP